MKKSSPSISVRCSLEKLGHDIRIARLRRDLTMQLVAERSKISDNLPKRAGRRKVAK